MTAFDRFLSSPTPWLADGGLETWMVFEEGLELPHFASFRLLETEEGRAALDRYFARFFALARSSGRGLVLDTATWRAGTEWGRKMGLGAEAVRDVNRRAAAFAKTLVARHGEGLPVVVNGVVGPSGDGYAPAEQLTAAQSRRCHDVQVQALAEAGVDMITAMTMTHSGEAQGIALAARTAGVPVAVSFTVETDGVLPSGEPLSDAIAAVDRISDGYPVFFLVNCAHPTHFIDRLSGNWTGRIGGIRANASRMSHAELDACETLDAGDPDEFGALYGDLKDLLPNLRLVGGCCGTDHRHVERVERHLPHPVPA